MEYALKQNVTEMWHLHSLPGAYSCMCCAKNVCIYESSPEEWKPHSKITLSSCL